MNCDEALFLGGSTHTIINTSFHRNRHAITTTGTTAIVINIINSSFFSHTSHPIFIGTANSNVSVSFSHFEGNGNTVEAGGCVHASASNVRYLSSYNRYTNNIGNSAGVLYITGGKTVMESDYYFNNSVITNSGVSHFSGDTTVRNCTFESNKATYSGGVGNINGLVALLITNCTFINNQAGSGSGALGFGANGNRNAILENSIFIKNRVTAGSGGAVSVFNNPLMRINTCHFFENHANGGAGGLEVIGSTTFLSLTSSTFDSNTGTLGAAIGVQSSARMNISDCLIINNYGTTSASGIYFSWAGVASVSNCTFRNQTSTSNGGAVDVFNTVAYISGSTFESNRGNTLRVSNSGTLFLSDSSFIDNTETRFSTASTLTLGSYATVKNIQMKNNIAPFTIEISGGSVSIEGLVMSNNKGPLKVGMYSFLSLSSSSFLNNRGGAIILDGLGSSANISNILCEGNTGTTYGGCLYCKSNANVTIFNSDFINNTAISYGGALANEGKMNVTNATMIGNKAIRGGGLWVATDKARATFSALSVGRNIAGSGGGIQIENYAQGISICNCYSGIGIDKMFS